MGNIYIHKWLGLNKWEHCGTGGGRERLSKEGAFKLGFEGFIRILPGGRQNIFCGKKEHLQNPEAQSVLCVYGTVRSKGVCMGQYGEWWEGG